MPAKTQRVSIVIRAFNEEKHIGYLLDALSKQSFQDFETILIDSGSTDHTLGIASRYPAKVMHIKPSEFTFGRSLNLGLRAAGSEIAVLASAHVLPLNDDWLAALIAPFSDVKVALAYGKQRGGPGTKFSEAQHFVRWFPDESDLDQSSAYCNNANLALRLELWRQHQFDEDLTGLEDLAWASYWKQQGYKIAYVAEAGVAHLHDETAAQIVNRHHREAIALKRILPKSRFTLKDFAGQYGRSVLSDLGAALRQRKALRELAGILSFRFLQYHGTYIGYHDSKDVGAGLAHVFYYPPGSLEKKQQSTQSETLKESRKSANP